MIKLFQDVSLTDYNSQAAAQRVDHYLREMIFAETKTAPISMQPFSSGMPARMPLTPTFTPQLIGGVKTPEVKSRLF